MCVLLGSQFKVCVALRFLVCVQHNLINQSSVLLLSCALPVSTLLATLTSMLLQSERSKAEHQWQPCYLCGCRYCAEQTKGRQFPAKTIRWLCGRHQPAPRHRTHQDGLNVALLGRHAHHM